MHGPNKGGVQMHQLAPPALLGPCIRRPAYLGMCSMQIGLSASGLHGAVHGAINLQNLVFSDSSG